MIVMKFGGTSVQDATAIRRVASIVTLRLAEQPLVVVSAMGGVTDKLVQAVALFVNHCQQFVFLWICYLALGQQTGHRCLNRS